MGQDVCDPDSHRAVARAAAQRGPVAVWVNNAGVLSAGDTWQMADTDVRRMVDVNVLGVMWGCHAAVPVMGEGGHIINIASISALRPTPGVAVYGATKHAVVGYSLSLASELRQAGKRIAVSALCPDAIRGDMTNAVAHDDAAALLFSAGTLLSIDQVADAAIELVDAPQLVRSLPRHRAAAIHLLRPFPSLGLPILEASPGSRAGARAGGSARSAPGYANAGLGKPPDDASLDRALHVRAIARLTIVIEHGALDYPQGNKELIDTMVSSLNRCLKETMVTGIRFNNAEVL